MVGQFLTAYFAADADLVALLGDRLYPQAAPPETTTDPYATYTVVSHTRVGSLKGPSGLGASRVQIDVYGRLYGTVQQVADTLKGTKADRRLDGYAGTLGGVNVRAALFVDKRDGYDEPAMGEGQGWHRASMDFEIWLEE